MADRNWKPWVIAIVAVLAAVLLIYVGIRISRRPSGVRNAAYAAQLSISAPTVSAADTMMAGSVTYFQGVLHNNGNRAVTRYDVGLVFSGIDGAPLQELPAQLVDDRSGELPAHHERHFQLGFDQVPAGWNQAPPKVQVKAVYTR